jgi:hypothetical protein
MITKERVICVKNASMKKINIYHERDRRGELYLVALIGEKCIRRRYLYYTLHDAKKHFKNYLNEIL